MIGKSLGALMIVLMFRYSLRTALTISASLAQIGEFSFILAALAVTLGLLPPEGQGLIVAGALLSISLNPLAFAASDRLNSWASGRPRLISALERPGSAVLLPVDGEPGGFEIRQRCDVVELTLINLRQLLKSEPRGLAARALVGFPDLVDDRLVFFHGEVTGFAPRQRLGQQVPRFGRELRRELVHGLGLTFQLEAEVIELSLERERTVL